MEWVEVRGKTVDIAVEAAMRELGITERDRVEIEILQQPERGFLGIGAKDAIVKVKPRSVRKGRGRHRRREGGRGRTPGREGEERTEQREAGPKAAGPKAAGAEPARAGGDGRRRGGTNGQGGRPSREGRPSRVAGEGGEGVENLTIDEQATLVSTFLEGLVDAFGIEGTVSVGIDEETIVAAVTGPQTEAMVGPRGSVIEAVHEVMRTVLSRRSRDVARVRLDIGGYAERRRQALSLYAGQLVDQILAEGGEIVLEPMSSADRKAVHDVVAARAGVRSYSEGEPPQRYVVIARVEEATASAEPEGSAEEE